MSIKYQVSSIKQQKGQIIIVLLLLMLVGLSVALALTQRSITDVATSTQSEQSNRAFSAAEAGLEKALGGSAFTGQDIILGNDSSAEIESSALLPVTGSFAGIEYPPIGRETTAQFWLVDPSSTAFPPTSPYTNSRVDLYYGNESTTDLPAVEVTFVMYTNGGYQTKTYYYDSSAVRTTGVNRNYFTQTAGCGSQNLITGILGNNRKFYCKQTVPSTTTDIPKVGGSGNCIPSNNCTLILARVRFLYINENHSLALAPVGGTPAAQLPPQVQIFNVTGTAGQSEKKLQAFRVKDVVPPWFDFAIFSVNEIIK